MKRKLKTITERLDKADKLADGMKAATDPVCDGLAASLNDALQPGESVPDLRLLLALFRRRVAGLARRVAACQDVLSDWQTCERYYAKERGTIGAELLRRLTQLRSLARCAFGQSGPELLGLAQAAPRDPKRLLKAAKLVAARLRDPNLMLPAAATPYLAVDLGPVTEELEADVHRLEETLDEGASAHAHVKTARDVRDHVIRDFDVVLLGTAAVTEYLCVLAGRYELARQIRRTTE